MLHLGRRGGAPGTKQRLHVVRVANAAAPGQGHETLVGGADDIDDVRPFVVAAVIVKKTISSSLLL